MYLRRRNYSLLQSHISEMGLKDEYRTYLEILILKHQKRYADAYGLLKSIESADIIALEIELAYRLKKYDVLIKHANDGKDVLKYLDKAQQLKLVSTMHAEGSRAELQNIIDNTSDANQGFLFSQIDFHKNDIFDDFTWEDYLEDVLAISAVEAVSMSYAQLGRLIEKQGHVYKELGYVMATNRQFENKDIQNSAELPFLKRLRGRKRLLQYLNVEILDRFDLGLSTEEIKTIKLQKYLRLDNFKGFDSEIYALLSEVPLNYNHIMLIRNLISRGRLDLQDETFRRLVKEEPPVQRVFEYLPFFTDKNLSEEIDEYVHETIQEKKRNGLYQNILEQYAYSKESFLIPQHLLKYLEKNIKRSFKYKIILAKHYYRTKQSDRYEVIYSKLGDRQAFELRLQVAESAYVQGNYTGALAEALTLEQKKFNDYKLLRLLINIYHKIGNITKRFEIVSRMHEQYPGRLFDKEYEIAKQELELFNHVWTLGDHYTSAQRSDIEGTNTVLYVLNKYIPVLNGYTIRSYELIEKMKSNGYRPVVTTRLGWSPVHEGYDIPTSDEMNAETYFIDRSQDFLTNRTPIMDYFNTYSNEILKIVHKENPSVIHAASNFQNALPALEVGRALGIRTIYEVRGMWHHTQSSKNSDFYRSERFELHENQELLCCDIADKVICISESLKQYLKDKGVPEDKITVIPNGVDTDVLKPIPPDISIRERLNLQDNWVIGFIGSITEYEGLDLVMKAVKSLNQTVSLGRRIEFIIVGDGPYRAELQKLALELNIESAVHFIGRVSRDEVGKYYSVVDIAPFPRQNKLVCRLVTPIKTYEAMAMEKKVIVSDVDALKEMVIEGQNGYIFKAEDVEDLVDKIKHCVNEDEIGARARQWVIEHRDWEVVAQNLLRLYE